MMQPLTYFGHQTPPLITSFNKLKNARNSPKTPANLIQVTNSSRQPTTSSSRLGCTLTTNCKQWTAPPPNKQTWANFKTHFQAACHLLQEQL